MIFPITRQGIQAKLKEQFSYIRDIGPGNVEDTHSRSGSLGKADQLTCLGPLQPLPVFQMLWTLE